MKRLLIFDDDGFYIGEEIVQNGTDTTENQYLAELYEEIAFHNPRLVDGKVVEGRSEDEISEEESIFINKEDYLLKHIAHLEFELMKLKLNK